MKRLKVCLLVGFLVVFLGGSCWGSGVYHIDTYALTASKLISLVDGSDVGSQVAFKVTSSFSSAWEFGAAFAYEGNKIDFTPFEFDDYDSWFGSGENGSTMDFAIRNGTKVYSLGMNDGVAYFNPDNQVEGNPGVYQKFSIYWGSETGLLTTDVEIATAKKYDGFAQNPSATVPIPTTAFLLGTGVLGLVGIRRKFMK
jgi:hypothetical protein